MDSALKNYEKTSATVKILSTIQSPGLCRRHEPITDKVFTATEGILPMVLLVTDVFLLLTQVLLWILVGLAARFVLLKALPKAFLGGLVLVLLVAVTAMTFFNGSPSTGLLGDLWQIISVVFNPFGLILVLLCVVWRDVENGAKFNKVLLRVGVASLLVFSLPIVANFLAQRTEMEAVQIMQPNVAPLPSGARRVIVLLGQNTTRLKLSPRVESAPPVKKPERNGFLPPPEPISQGRLALLASLPVQLTEQGDRILGAAQVFNSERENNPLLIVSAGPRLERMEKGEKKEDISETADITKLLQTQFGIPGSAIIADSNSRSVIESAQNVRKILEDRNINYGNQIMVVTSAIEASRTALTFGKELAPDGQGITIISRPTDFYTIPPKSTLETQLKGRDVIERNFMVSDLIPTVDSLQLSTKVLNEALTSLYYFLRGWIRPLRAG
jgi:uncharacterized SAM-binding protein YcdF (DUF218 family)